MTLKHSQEPPFHPIVDLETEHFKYPKVCSMWPRLRPGAARTALGKRVLRAEPAKTSMSFHRPLMLLERKLVNYLSGCWQQNPQLLFPEKSHFLKKKQQKTSLVICHFPEIVERFQKPSGTF